MPEAAFAELDFKSKLKMELFPTIWCPGCGIGTIMIELAMVLDELGLDQSNTVIVTGIGCTGRMGSYMKFDAVYTLHGRTLPVAEAIKTVRPELNVIVVAGDGDTASIGGNHLIHAIRRNARVTVLCNNNEIYGLTGGQTGPTTPSGTKTLSSPGGNPNTPINLQGIVRSSPHALYARTTVYHQPQMRTAIREAIQHDGFSFVDITSQCIENNGRRIGFANANEMLTFYRKTYKRAPKGADRLGPFELGILYPEGHPEGTNGETDGAAPAATNGAATQTDAGAAGAAEAPAAAKPAAERPSVSDDEKARKRAEAQKKLALMQRLDPAVKLQVAKGEVTLADALRAAGIDPAELESVGAESACMATRIALDGVGGQGVRLIAGILGSLLARMGKQVTVLLDYDSSVRGSMSDAFVIFDDAPIDNPVVEEADILLRLADRGHLRISGRKVVTDLGLGAPGDEQIPFASLGSEHFGKELFGNMIALGRLLKLAAIEYDEAAIRDSLPRRYQDENVAAIRFGYDLTDAEIARLAAAAPPSRFEMNDAATAPLHKRTGIHSGESVTDASLAESG